MRLNKIFKNTLLVISAGIIFSKKQVLFDLRVISSMFALLHATNTVLHTAPMIKNCFIKRVPK